MLYTERAELILQQLQLQAVVKISDLAELMQVSVDTVRRDLKAMEQNGLVKCVRGGACLPESLVSLSSFSGRSSGCLAFTAFIHSSEITMGTRSGSGKYR